MKKIGLGVLGIVGAAFLVYRQNRRAREVARLEQKVGDHYAAERARIERDAKDLGLARAEEARLRGVLTRKEKRAKEAIDQARAGEIEDLAELARTLGL